MTMRVALTFDAEHPDRPNCAPGVPEALVELLGDRGVRATFFLQGRWVEAYPETARRIVVKAKNRAYSVRARASVCWTADGIAVSGRLAPLRRGVCFTWAPPSDSRVHPLLTPDS